MEPNAFLAPGVAKKQSGAYGIYGSQMFQAPGTNWQQHQASHFMENMMPPVIYDTRVSQMPHPGSGWNSQGIAPYEVAGSLNYLAHVDQLLVQQKVELLEAFTGLETSNKYSIKNNLGQVVFYAAEDSDCCTRICCGPIRSFNMRIFNTNQQEILNFKRPLRCNSCCCFCCLQEMEVFSTPETHLGSIVQNWTLFRPDFSINDAQGNTVFKITGPFCTFSLCGEVEFSIFSARNGEEIGKISKQWSGLAAEAFTDADNFGIVFPHDLEVGMKAVLLAALFLIDFMFFEKSGNNEPGMF